MSTENVLKTETRSSHGSRASRKARREGRVPMIIFGHGQPNVSVTVGAHELGLALATTSQVFGVEVDGKHESCLVKEVQYDTFGQDVLHVDLARIDLTEEVEVVVALDFRGNAKGLADGGAQMIYHPSLAVHCPAGAIPGSILVDVSELELGQSIHAGEIALPTGVKLDEGNMAADEAIVGVIVPKKVEEVVEATDEALEGETPAEGDAAPATDADADAEADKKDGD